MNKNLLFSTLLFAFTSLTVGCGSSGSDDFFDEFPNDQNPPAANPESGEAPPAADPIADPVATPTPASTEVVTEIFGRDGNLYKPFSDDHGAGGGNLVVLMSSRYTKRFETCEIPLKDGTTAQLTCIDNQPWTHTPYSCFANGDRQHWRASFRCSSVAQIRVRCRLAGKTYIFTVDEGSRGNVCTRYG